MTVTAFEFFLQSRW